MKIRFVRHFFSLIVWFYIHFRIELGFEGLLGLGSFYQLLRPGFDRAVHEFRDIIDDNTCLVIFRTFLRQKEGLAESPFGIEIAEVKMSARSILTFTAENHPTPVT